MIETRHQLRGGMVRPVGLAVAMAVAIATGMTGCITSNAFKDFYQPNRDPGPPLTKPLEPGTNASIVNWNANDPDQLRTWIKIGYVDIGRSNFTAPLQRKSDLIRFATSVDASHALYSKTYLGTHRGVIPITTYRPTTTYTTGTVQGDFGSATYSGTTHGREASTTMVPYAIDRYEHRVIYLARIAVTPATGVHAMDLTPAETVKYQRNTGVRVHCVLDDSPAFEANILMDDLIIAANGEEIRDVTAWVDFVERHRGEEIIVDILRNGTPVGITFTTNPGSPAEPRPEPASIRTPAS